MPISLCPFSPKEQSSCPRSHVLLVPFFAALALFSRNFYSDPSVDTAGHSIVGSWMILPQRSNRKQRQRRDGHLFFPLLTFLFWTGFNFSFSWKMLSAMFGRPTPVDRSRQGRAAIPPLRSLGAVNIQGILPYLSVVQFLCLLCGQFIHIAENSS